MLEARVSVPVYVNHQGRTLPTRYSAFILGHPSVRLPGYLIMSAFAVSLFSAFVNYSVIVYKVGKGRGHCTQGQAKATSAEIFLLLLFNPKGF